MTKLLRVAAGTAVLATMTMVVPAAQLDAQVPSPGITITVQKAWVGALAGDEATITADTERSVVDDFSATSHAISVGTFTWETDWVESGETTNPASNPDTGDMKVNDGAFAGRMRLRNLDLVRSISRTADLTAMGDDVDFTVDWEVAEMNGSQEAVEVLINGTSAGTFTGATGDTGTFTYVVPAADLTAATSVQLRGAPATGGWSAAEAILVDNVTFRSSTPESGIATAAGGDEPAATITSISAEPGAEVTLSESVVGSSSDMALACDGGPVTLVANAATITPTADTTCVFTNTTRPAEITIVHDAIPNSRLDVTFSGDGPIGSFQLDDDTNATLPNTRTFTVPAGTYSVTETELANLKVSAITCVPTGTASALPDAANETVDIDVGPGDAVTCTFENRPAARVRISKNVTPNAAVDSTFTADHLPGGSVTITGDGRSGYEFVDPLDGTVVITEQPLDGYVLASSSCGPNGVFDQGARTMSVTVTYGESRTCSFVNEQLGRITVAKETVPDGEVGSFVFSGDAFADDPVLADGESISVDVAPGTHTVSEADAPGWRLTDIVCPGDNSSGRLATRAAFFRIAPGEDVTCTFTNTKLGAITVVKATDPADLDPPAGGFRFTLSTQAAQTLPAGSSYTWTDLRARSYNLRETAAPGFDLGSVACVSDDGSPVVLLGDGATIGLLAGDDVTCTFTNNQRPTVTITKRVTDTSDVASSFVFDPSAGSNFRLDANPGTTRPDTVAYVAPLGVSSIRELVPARWIVDDITCTTSAGGSATPDLTVATVSFDLGPGETASCTFTNQQLARIRISKDVRPNGPETFEFTGAITTTLGDGQNSGWVEVDPRQGPFVVAETPMPGFRLTRVRCDGASVGDAAAATATFNVIGGQAHTCAFRNVAVGSITIVKQTDPDADPQPFEFTSTFGAGPWSVSDDQSFTLGDLAAGTYRFNEVLDPNWRIDSIVCSDTNSAGATASGRIVVRLAAGEDVTCTVTNYRLRTELTLGKAWVDSVAGDSADLAIDVGRATGSSLAPTSGSAVATVFAGEEIELTETLASPSGATYRPELACDDGNLDYTAGDFVAALGIEPGDTLGPISCTFTNTAQRGTIIVTKTTDGGDGVFGFTGGWSSAGVASVPDGLDPAGFSITTVAGSGAVEFMSVLTGTYELAEVEPTLAFDGSTMICDETDPTTISFGDTDGADGLAGTIGLDANETVTCIFSNIARGRIVINKVADPALDVDFEFVTTDPTGTLPVSFELNGAAPSAFESDPVPANETYTITETSTPGWAPPAVTCTGGATVNGDAVSAAPAPGEIVECTFTNRALPATLDVTKSVSGQDGEWGPFTIELSGQASQTVDSTDPSVNFLDLVPGRAYTVSEPLTAGYTNGEFDCTEQRADGTEGALADGDPATDGHQFTATPGSAYSCSIDNAAIPSSLQLDKTVAGVDATYDWTFTIAIDPAAELAPATDQSVSGTGDGTDSVMWASLTPGREYTIEEQASPAGVAGPLACSINGVDVDDGNDSDQSETFIAPVGIGAGPAVACTITNAFQPSDLTVQKTVAGIDPTLDWSFEFAIAPVPTGAVSPQSVSGTGSAADRPAATWGNIVTGTSYVVSEVTSAGYAQELTCTGVTDLDTESTTVTFEGPAVATDIECGATNAADPIEIAITKQVAGVDAALPWVFAVSLEPTPTGLQSPQIAAGTGESSAVVGWTGLTPGTTYSVTETPVAGYSVDIKCDGLVDTEPADETFTFVAPTGVDVTCVIVNDADPIALTYEKTSIGGTGGFEFVLGGDQTAMTAVLANAGPTAGPQLVAGGTYEVTETDPGSEWVAGDVACVITHPDQTTSEFGPLEFTTTPGDAVACAVENIATGTIRVVKAIDGPSDGTFEFAVTGGAIDGTRRVTTVNGAGEFQIDDVVPNGVAGAPMTYTIEEVDAGAAFDGTSLACTDSEANGTPTTVDDLIATITLDPGETVTCTFTNTERGIIVVEKETAPDGDPTEFTFNPSYAIAGPADAVIADGESFSSVLLAGNETYTVSEILPDGWVVNPDLAGPSCRAQNSTWQAMGAGVEITLAAGETVTCTFSNARTGAVAVTKNVESIEATSPTEFDVTYSVVADNTAYFEQTYDLVDELLTPALVTDVVFTPPPGITPTIVGSGAGPYEILGTPLAGRAQHEWTVVVSFSVDPALARDGRRCGAGPTGFHNTVNGVSACIDIPNGELTIAKTAGLPVRTGPATYTVPFTVEVANIGQGPAIYEVDDVPGFPADAVIVSTAIDGVVDAPDAAGALSPGETVVHEFRFVVDVSSVSSLSDLSCELGGGFENVASIGAGDLMATASACADIPAVADVAVEIVDILDPVIASSSDEMVSITYRVTVTNNGPTDVTGLTIDEQLPAGVTMSVESLRIGDLGAAATTSYEFTVLVDDVSLSSIEVSVVAAVDQDEIELINNSATESTQIVRPTPPPPTTAPPTTVARPAPIIPTVGGNVTPTIGIAAALLLVGLALTRVRRRPARSA